MGRSTSRWPTRPKVASLDARRGHREADCESSRGSRRSPPTMHGRRAWLCSRSARKDGGYGGRTDGLSGLRRGRDRVEWKPLAACAKAVDALGTDLDDHSFLAGAEVGILVLAEILFRDHVYVLERAFLEDLA